MTDTVIFPAKFQKKYTLSCGGRLIDLSSPAVMGILNLTPDSFFDGGKFTEENIIISHVEQMVLHGALIIDLGAASSRPGSALISEEEEVKRLLPMLRVLRKKFSETIFSVDTWRSEIARKAVDEGADIINDISGGEMDKKMFETVAALKIPYILMHLKGTPQTMQQEPTYENVVTEVLKSLQSKVRLLHDMGVNDIIVDPGFGFGKTVDHNYQLLAHLELFHQLNCPLLAGFSRKSMINKLLNISAKEALNGTTILNTIALQKGVHLLRVHDVKEASECIRICDKMNSAN